MKLRKAAITELPAIWEIIQQAIGQRKQEGSQQWQDGYPNESTLQADMDRGYAHVLTQDKAILAYVAIIPDKEPAYEDIVGKWLTNGDYMGIHRVAVSEHVKGKGIATRLFEMIEGICIDRKVYSIKIDTNFDNIPMLKILNRSGYTYCGEVFFRGSARKAFEKVLTGGEISES